MLKEGAAEDFTNREAVLKLLRFTSTTNEESAQRVSLGDYVGRMQDEQKNIYYLVADSLTAARQSPHLEVFRQRGIEVLLLTDRIDEWFISFVQEFDGKSLTDVARGELDLPGDAKEDEKAADDGDDALCKRIADVLEGRVESVRRSTRLTDSRRAWSSAKGTWVRRCAESWRRRGRRSRRPSRILRSILAIPWSRSFEGEPDEDRFADFVKVLFDQASLAEGQALNDPGDYVRRVNRLLLELAGG